MTILNSWISALRGTPAALREQRRAIQQQPGILSGLAQLQNLVSGQEVQDDLEQPVFLLSAGWRSGSTLLQRLIMSDPRVLIWGEPFDECGIVQELAGTLIPFRAGWPPDDYYYEFHNTGSAQELSTEWIANLFPGLSDLRLAHRAFFDRLFALPAKNAGSSIWGIKEVRLDIEHAFYLRWIYPKAKFVLLYRNPLKAYQSYCRYGRNWYNIWPDKPVFTPYEFGSHWQKLLSGFIRDAEKLGGLLVCYEDFVQGNGQLERLENYLDIKINHDLLDNKVGSSRDGRKNVEIGWFEKMLLRRAVSPLVKELNYIF